MTERRCPVLIPVAASTRGRPASIGDRQRAPFDRADPRGGDATRDALRAAGAARTADRH